MLGNGGDDLRTPGLRRQGPDDLADAAVIDEMEENAELAGSGLMLDAGLEVPSPEPAR